MTEEEFEKREREIVDGWRVARITHLPEAEIRLHRIAIRLIQDAPGARNLDDVVERGGDLGELARRFLAEASAPLR